MENRVEIPKRSTLKTITRPQDLSEIGKLPPQAIDLAEAILGALMLEKSPLNDVIDIIHQPEIFYKEAHQKIYAAIQDLFSSSESIDILTVQFNPVGAIGDFCRHFKNCLMQMSD